MANHVSADKRRVTYTEWKDSYDILKGIADSERLDLSDLIRRATLDFVQRHQKKLDKMRTPRGESAAQTISHKKTK